MSSIKIKIEKGQFDNWIKWCVKINKEYSIEKEKFCKEKPNTLNLWAIINISDALNEDDIIVCGNASACIILFKQSK